MSIDTALSRNDGPDDVGEPMLMPMIIAAMLSIFTEFGSQRFSRLLDTIAETEYFHELTMID
jgi:hypothetical protein